ncbi:hypothetical protein F5X71_30760 [Nocardia brasiliensis]|uniref:Uncharacterized protein n=1 Tax=Nocardia brasiliensis TaxID=37326 RepID=A0A6G9XYS8_NOCBR|nr:DUF6401 family natural product biosynthesis protein [Nocardia brasiliensis]QIS06105.1 hypothetical protein F5X71_30760 [Nocardia brasiliensis]
MFLLGPALLEVSARKILNRLHKTHGVPALAAAAQLPALSAALDQHAAAVRDILEWGVEDAAKVPAPVLLAGYARGLLDQVREAATGAEGTGLTGAAPGDLGSWASADWLQLRLAGVCLHAARTTA